MQINVNMYVKMKLASLQLVLGEARRPIGDSAQAWRAPREGCSGYTSSSAA